MRCYLMDPHNLCGLRAGGSDDNKSVLNRCQSERLAGKKVILARRGFENEEKHSKDGYRSDCFNVGGLRDVADNSKIECCEK